MVRSSLSSSLFHIDPYRIRREGNKSYCEADSKRNERPRLFVPRPILNTSKDSHMFVGERILHDLQGWLTPPDPSTNHNTACGAQHERTAVWVFSEDIYKKWESSGSLLWIHGKGWPLEQTGMHVL